MNGRQALKYFVYAAVLGGIGFFFYRAFEKNWDKVAAHQFKLDYVALALALFTLVATYIVSMYGWHRSINALSRGPQLTISQSLAAVNSSNLTKYLPGKVWSYAFQLYWLSGAGFSKALITYVNVINLAISIVTTLIAGFFLLLFNPGKLGFGATLAALVGVVVADLVAVKFHAPLIRFGLSQLGRLLKRELTYFEPPPRVWLELHAAHLAAAFTFGLAAYFTSLAIGYSLPLSQAPLVMAALLIADLVGFVAIFVPGGLGVREGFMYVMLGGAGSGSLALTLPLAIRMLNMVVDLGLGGLALHLSRGFARAKPGAPPPPQEIPT
ncbi:MAG TPA: lysylphosphatidylglycerol synthase domain-containing protein [Polyangiaceae bacterium]|nr:lysylphosphatidylglycerol synthase domain-containing protein [Polyangiaceae bacterium]